MIIHQFIDSVHKYLIFYQSFITSQLRTTYDIDYFVSTFPFGRVSTTSDKIWTFLLF